MKLVLSSGQFRLLATFFREISQAAVIGAFAVWMLPEAVGFEAKGSLFNFLQLFSSGLTALVSAVILEKRGEIR